MKQSKPKFTPADRKAIALSAFLFYTDREYHVDLFKCEHDTWWTLRVTYEDTRTLDFCPLLSHNFISLDVTHVGYSDNVATWIIPLED